jgi:hypothetical protein
MNPMNESAHQLLQRIETAGLADVYNLLGEGNTRAHDWEKMAPALPGETQALWRFFMLGRPLPAQRAARLLGKEALGFLQRHKLCRAADGELTLGDLSLLSFRGTRFFAERSPFGRSCFSDDTRALMTLVPRRERGTCLSLYPGSGASVLPLASRSTVEVSFLHGPVNRGLIRANLELNAAGASPRFLALERCPNPGPYDVIAASPPCGLEVSGGRLAAWMSGGRDGRQRLREVLDLAEKALAPGGTLAMTFLFFSDPDPKAMEEQLRAFLGKSGLSWSLTVCSKHFLEPGAPVFNTLLNAAVGGKAAGAAKVLKKLLRHLRRLKFGAVYLIKGRFSRAPAPVRREMANYSEMYYGAWVF